MTGKVICLSKTSWIDLVRQTYSLQCICRKNEMFHIIDAYYSLSGRSETCRFCRINRRRRQGALDFEGRVTEWRRTMAPAVASLFDGSQRSYASCFWDDITTTGRRIFTAQNFPIAVIVSLFGYHGRQTVDRNDMISDQIRYIIVIIILLNDFPFFRVLVLMPLHSLWRQWQGRRES